MATYKALTEENCNDFKNFKYSEFKCKCKGKYCKGYPVPFSYQLASHLQKIRDNFKKPVIITSPLRCKQHNKNSGGTSNSPHMKGWAVDFYIDGVSYDKLYSYVKKLPYYSYAYRVKKNQNVIHYSITPPSEIQVVSTVKRDEFKDQLKVLADELRVRTGASTNASIVGVAKKNCIYNYFETKKDSKYTWYRIADKQWVANNGKYLTVYSKTEGEDEKVIAELQKQVQELTDKNVLLEKTNQELQAQIKEKETNEYKNIYKCAEDGDYNIKIKMYKDEELYIK